MSDPFEGPNPAGGAGNALGNPTERAMDEGPLPVVKDIVALANRLSAEHERVVAGKNDCCVAICAPDMEPGWPVETLVQHVAERYAYRLRSYDSIFLYGRDRILVCLPHIEAGDASNVLVRLRDIGLEQTVPMPTGTTTLTTVSVGGVMMDRTAQVQETIDRAEIAMETARKSGGNKTCMWTAEML